MICDMCAKENKCNTAILKNGLRVSLCDKCSNELKEMKHILSKGEEGNK